MEQVTNFERQQNTNSYSRAVTYLDQETNELINGLAKEQSKSRSYILSQLIEKGFKYDGLL